MQRRIDELVGRYLDGSASPLEVRQLDEALQSDPEAARTLIEMAALETQLTQTIQLERGAAQMAAEGAHDMAASSASPSKTTSAKSKRAAKGRISRETARRAWWRSGWVAATVAASLLVAAIAWQIVGRSGRTVDTRIAQVKDVQGEVQRLSEGVWRALKIGDDIERGDKIRVGAQPGAAVKIVYLDETELRLHPYTEVVLTQPEGAKHVYLAVGKIYAEIQPQSPGAAMVFETDDATATVLGTTLELTRWDDKTVLNVIDGKVRFEQWVTVETNRFATTNKGKPFQPQPGRPPVAAQPKPGVPSGQFELPDETLTPRGVASDGWDLWVCCGGRPESGPVPKGRNPKQNLYQLRPIDGAVLRTLDLGEYCQTMGATSLTFGKWEGKPYLWVGDFFARDDVIHVINPDDGLKVRELTEVPQDITDLAFGDDELWCLTQSQTDHTEKPQIYRISAKDGTEIDRFDSPVIDGYQSLAYHDGHLWLHAVDCGTPGPGIYMIDPKSHRIVAKYRTPALKAKVLGLCHDPRGQLWMVDAAGRWLRPVEVSELEEFPTRRRQRSGERTHCGMSQATARSAEAAKFAEIPKPSICCQLRDMRDLPPEHGYDSYNRDIRQSEVHELTQTAHNR